jgi:hypothetical protein
MRRPAKPRGTVREIIGWRALSRAKCATPRGTLRFSISRKGWRKRFGFIASLIRTEHSCEKRAVEIGDILHNVHART